MSWIPGYPWPEWIAHILVAIQVGVIGGICTHFAVEALKDPRRTDGKDAGQGQP